MGSFQTLHYLKQYLKASTFFPPFKLPSTLHISKPWTQYFKTLNASLFFYLFIFLSSKPAWMYVCLFFFFFFLLYVTYLKPWMQYYTPFKLPFFPFSFFILKPAPPFKPLFFFFSPPLLFLLISPLRYIFKTLNAILSSL